MRPSHGASGGGEADPFRLGVPERHGQDGQVLLLAPVAGVGQRAREGPPRQPQRLRRAVRRVLSSCAEFMCRERVPPTSNGPMKTRLVSGR